MKRDGYQRFLDCRQQQQLWQNVEALGLEHFEH